MSAPPSGHGAPQALRAALEPPEASPVLVVASVLALAAVVALALFVGWLRHADDPVTGRGRIIQVSLPNAMAAPAEPSRAPAAPPEAPAPAPDDSRHDDTARPAIASKEETPAPTPAPPRAAASAAPSPELLASFQQAIYDHIARFRRYPAAARAARLRGMAQVYFEVDQLGGVSNVRVVSSSGHLLLDAEAIDTIRRAAPLPRVPPGLPGRQRVLLPIEFSPTRSAS